MERGSINGTPVWIRVVDTTIGERVAIKESPFVNGAVVRRLGGMPERFTIEFKLVNDGVWITSDAETAALELRATIAFGGPFTVLIPSRGEIRDLDLAEAVSIKPFDDAQEGIAEGRLSLIKGDPFPILQDDAAALVASSISSLAAASQSDLAERVPEVGVFQAFLDTFNETLDWMDDVAGIIGAAFEPVNDVAGEIATLRTDLERLVGTPERLVNQFYRTGARLLSLVPSLAQQGDARNGSTAVQDPTSDAQADVYKQALALATDFDSGLPPTQGDVLGDAASEEDRQENDERAAAQSVSLSMMVASVCLATTSSTFSTSNAIVELSEALLPTVERALDVLEIDPEVYEQTRITWKATLKFLQEQAGALPRLRSHITDRDTDAYTLLPDLYPDDLDGLEQVELAVNQIATINQIEDVGEIPADTTIRYLRPLA
jgi:prophage DNA circulation protein